MSQDTRTQDTGAIVEIRYADGTVIRQGETEGGLAPNQPAVLYARNVPQERRGMAGGEIAILLGVALTLSAMLAALWYKTEASWLSQKVQEQETQIQRLEGGLLYGE